MTLCASVPRITTNDNNNAWLSTYERYVHVYDVTVVPTAKRGAGRFREKMYYSYGVAV